MVYGALYSSLRFCTSVQLFYRVLDWKKDSRSKRLENLLKILERIVDVFNFKNISCSALKDLFNTRGLVQGHRPVYAKANTQKATCLPKDLQQTEMARLIVRPLSQMVCPGKATTTRILMQSLPRLNHFDTMTYYNNDSNDM